MDTLLGSLFLKKGKTVGLKFHVGHLSFQCMMTLILLNDTAIDSKFEYKIE